VPALLLSLIVFAIAVAGVVAGVRLAAVRSVARTLVAFSGGLLMGVAAFWVLPDLAVFFGWPAALAWVSAGVAGLWFINRFVHPVCPTCSHTHDHDQCSTRLHGFAGPILTVAAFHSFLDGWVLSASDQESSAGLAGALLLGIAAHKLPEGLALGVIVRASVRGVAPALAGSILVQALTIAGAASGSILVPHLGTEWAHSLLALAAGSFLFLGYHAVHGEYRRGGAAPAFMPALTGVAGSSMIQLFGSRLFHH
jgi:zinc transporter ZupT